MPWRGVPFPTGTIDSGERAASAFMYSGIDAGGTPPASSDFPYIPVFRRRRFEWIIAATAAEELLKWQLLHRPM